MPRVSVILTSFNHEPFLRQAIESVLQQSFEDYELIIWDDASSDNSWNIIQEFSDPRIKSFRNNKPRRGAYGINKAIAEVATGQFIAIHHSDDLWEKDKLRKQIDYLEQNDSCGAVFTSVQIIDSFGKKFVDSDHNYYSRFEQPNRTRFEWLRDLFFNGNCLCHPSVMVRKKVYETIGLYDRRLGLLGDFDMWIRIALMYDIHILEDKLTKFRILQHEANSSGDRPAVRSRYENEFRQVLRNYRKIDSIEDLILVFPEIRTKINTTYNCLDYLIATMAIKHSNIIGRIFGLETLYELMGAPGIATLLSKNYGFEYRDLVELAGAHGIGEEYLAHNDNLEAYISELKNTWTWRITRPIRVIEKFIRGKYRIGQ